MASNLGDLVATATLDIAPFMTNTRNLKTYMKGIDNSLKTVENSFKGQSDKLNGLRSIYEQTGRSLQGHQTILKKQSEHFNKLKSEIGDLSKATEKEKATLASSQSAMTATAANVAELQNKYNSLGREIATQSSVFTKFGQVATDIGGKLKKAGDGLSGVGSALTKGVTVPLVTGAGLATKAAIEYEDAFAGVKKTVDETATTSYAKLSAGIRDMAKQLPASVVEIANVAESAGQLGISADNVLSFTRTMIDMGESTNMSATDAATSIAKIANITGMTADEYQRFGSSVVALGNNFATTENDIVMMSNRLAAAGKLAGLTNQEILGLATAMSSVGIEAEAGGTAMTQTLTAIEKAVVDGGEKLNKFAIISGMSSQQFTEAWRNKPADALQSFIKGIDRLSEKGGSATLILDDLGLEGIRQSNMIKSLALASDTMGKAVDMSNKAWRENSALSDEASKRYETTGSKLKMLKNEANDLAIEMGGPLVDALRDGLEAGKPFIQSLGDLAKNFSSLDKEQQQQIIKWGLMAAAAGPAFSILGKGVGIIGSVIGGLGKASTTLGKFSGWIKTLGTASKGIEAVSATAGTATVATTGLSGAIGLLANPVTWGVLLGGVAVGAVAYYAQKANEARQRTEEWGASISKAEAQELSAFKDKVDEANRAMSAFGTEGVEDVEAIRNAFSELTGEITKLVDENLAKDLELAKKMGFTEEQLNQLNVNAKETKTTVQAMSDEVVNIYKNANDQRRQLSEEEKQIVLSAQNALIKEQLEQLKYSGKEKEAIVKAMNGEVDDLNSKQLEKALATTKKWIEAENKEYSTRKKALKDWLEDGKISQSDYYQHLERLEAEHSMKMEAYGEKYIAIQKKMSENTSFGGNKDAETAYWNFIKKQMDDLGLSYEELQNKMSGMAETASQASSLVGQYWQGMSEEASSAVTYWNSLVLDTKTGEVKTNAQEEIQKALQAEGGWEAMQLSLKEGRMTTTAKIAVGEALIATGQWEALTPSEKALVTDNKPALEAILSSKEMLIQWNAMPEEVKRILGDNQDFISNADVAKNALAQWNMMTPTQKALTAKNLTSPDVNLAQSTINSLTGKTVGLHSTNQTHPGVDSATGTLNLLPSYRTVTINAKDHASGVIGGILSGLQSVANNVWTATVRAVKSVGYAMGTNYHPGGLAMVNDQKGPLYKEVVTLPSGDSFIPEGRDVILPLPRGSKVLKASDTRKLFPHYANGIGFENTKIANVTRRLGTGTQGGSGNSIESMLSQLISLLSNNTETQQALDVAREVAKRPITMVLEDGTLVAKITPGITELQNRNLRIENRMKGVLD